MLNALLVLIVALIATLYVALRRVQATTAALRDSEATFRASTEAMQEGIVVRERSGRLVVANVQGREILGLTAEQLDGHQPLGSGWAAFHEDGRPWPQEDWPSYIALREGEPQRDRVMGLRMAWGETIWLSVSAVPLMREGEVEPYRVVTAFSDITVKKRREDRTRRQIERAHDANAELAQANARLAEAAQTDGLTGLRNRRALQEGLVAGMDECERKGLPFSLILLDVDEFKSYNDRFGHPAGDEALRRVARLISDAARKEDVAARYGGEEFAILLPDTNALGAMAVAERLRKSLEAAPWELRRITASFGLATVRNGGSPEQLVADADAALFRAKRAGRNLVCHADEAILSLPVPEGYASV